MQHVPIPKNLVNPSIVDTLQEANMPASTQSKSRSRAQSPISTRKAAKAIASPVRQELLDCIEAIGPCTIAQAAQHVGRAPDSLYFHTRSLERVGLLVRVKTPKRAKGTTREPAMYDVYTRPMSLAYRKPIQPTDLTAIASGMLRLAQRDIKSALASPKHAEALQLEGPERQLWFARAKGWLLPQDLIKLNELLSQALALVRSRKPTTGAQSLSLVFAFAPSATTKRSFQP